MTELAPQALVDFREKALPPYLIQRGVRVQLVSLDAADVVLSDVHAIQIKNGRDLVDSIIDGRFDDIPEQKLVYPQLMLLIENKGLAYSDGRLSKKAIDGAIAAAEIKWGVSVHHTNDIEDTADLIERMVFKISELHGGKTPPLINRKRPPMTPEQRQSYFLQGLLHCGPEMADKLIAAGFVPYQVINLIGITGIRLYDRHGKILSTPVFETGNPLDGTGAGVKFFLDNYYLLGCDKLGGKHS